MRSRQPGRWARVFHDPNGLKQVTSRRGWIAVGVVLEVAGVGAPLAVVVARAKRASITEQITRPP